MKRRDDTSAAEQKRKKRRGRRKSKAERLARAAPAAASLDDLLRLLRGSSSREWDAAQRLALGVGSLEARATVVRVILSERQAPRAAAHYAKRLELRGDELLAAVAAGAPAPLLTAQFLVELDEHALSTREKLQRFLWPWLLQSAEKMEDKAGVKAAVHLMLHPTASDDAKALSKKERGRRLQRELVTQCLRTGELLHLVPTHARAFSDRVTLDSPGDYEVDANDQVDADEGLDKEKQRRQQIARRVQNVLRLMWPDARVLLFGSSVTGLWTPADKTKTEQADVDLCALLPSAPQFRQETAPLVTEVKEHLALYLLPDGTSEGEQDMTAVTRARIPIVHFQDPATELPCDLCVNNVPALWNTRLLHSLLRGDLNASCTERRRLHQARRLCQWLRQWRHSKKRVVGGALSSYGLTLLALYYLQRISVLPVLDCSSHVVENESSVGSLTEGDIDKELERLKRIYVSDEDHAKGSAKNWQALRRGFFRFYTCDFDYENTVVSLRKTEVMPKTSKGWSRQNNTRLCLEDPVEIERDLGTLCSRLALGRLRCAFAHACIVLSENEEDLDTESTSTEHDLEADLLASWAFEEDCSREKDSHETEG